MARILITGASGFIGGHLVAQALERGHVTTAAVRSGSDRSRLSDPRLRLLDFPLSDVAAMTRLLQTLGPFDWVIHNAGVTKAWSPEAYVEGNVGNTRRLVEALQAVDWVPDKFLFISSLAALGPASPGSSMIVAGQTPQPLTLYGESKRLAEAYLESLPAEFPWVVVQPTAVYGPWERDILTFIRLAQKGLELTIGRQQQRLSFIHVRDVAEAVLQMLETQQTLQRKYILADGKAYRTDDLGAAVREALGRTKTIKIRLPLGLVRQVAGVAETMGRWRNKPSALNLDKIPELAAENWHSDASPLFELLNFRPQFDLYQGMINTVDWYRKERWL